MIMWPLSLQFHLLALVVEDQQSSALHVPVWSSCTVDHTSAWLTHCATNIFLTAYGEVRLQHISLVQRGAVAHSQIWTMSLAEHMASPRLLLALHMYTPESEGCTSATTREQSPSSCCSMVTLLESDSGLSFWSHRTCGCGYPGMGWGQKKQQKTNIIRLKLQSRK